MELLFGGILFLIDLIIGVYLLIRYIDSQYRKFYLIQLVASIELIMCSVFVLNDMFSIINIWNEFAFIIYVIIFFTAAIIGVSIKPMIRSSLFNLFNTEEDDNYIDFMSEAEKEFNANIVATIGTPILLIISATMLI